MSRRGRRHMKDPRLAGRGSKNHSLAKATSSVAIVTSVGGSLGVR